MFFTNRFYSFDFAYKKELYFFITVVVAAFMGLSLYSYNVYDPSWFHYFSDPQQTQNLCGMFGANIASVLIYLLGTASYLVPVFIVTSGYLMWDTSDFKEEWERFAAMLGLLVSVSVLVTVHRIDLFHSSVAGGYVGYGMTVLLYRLFDQVGSIIFAYVGVYASLVLLVRFSFIGTARFLIRITSQTYDFLVRHRVAQRTYAIIVFVARSCDTVVRYCWKWVDGSAFDTPEPATNFAYEQEQAGSRWEPDQQQFSSSGHEELFEQQAPPAHEESYEQQDGIVDESGSHAVEESKSSSYGLPNLDIFIGVDDQREDKQFKRELEERARILEEKLERFGVYGNVISIKSGPVVTLFEYQPTIDTKVSKILALEDDLAMTLQALSIRILAPIPGRSVVGFEVANKKRKDVLLASVIQSPEYLEFDGLLPLILGQNTVGEDVVVDLAKMPHLLIAGSTGSGKSVALNSMLISLLCKCTPDELRMILIDPKRLEFAPYADISHLLFPIVTDPKQSVPVLKWVVKQMESRYEQMSHYGVRNVFEYNKLAKAQGVETFPFIVIVIDELSDLMMTVGREVEYLITRITQMARAAGIHMIIATQRPSVDVITGLIKVNFPSRISCRVTSKVDSRTILDCGGADKLLGRGDMLFLDSTASVLRRVHGAYVSDSEINTVASHIRDQRVVEYLDITEELAADETDLSSEDEELYKKVVSYLDSVEEISISSLQRAFRIGYNRSARIIAMLEMHGLIMPADGSRTRRVIR
ncbi:DNA translocase FtsK [Candidatus Dependentiae bacterium]|nr:MAG: DNA translocase FtsK [Candidatus Dependentiae bacterium]